MDDVLREFFVSVGVKMNETQFNALNSKLRGLDEAAGQITNRTARGIAGATIAVTTFLATTTAGVANFLGGLAQSDIEMQMFARRMWMTTENAKSLKIVLDAMGMSLSELDDIAMNSELRKYFTALRDEARSLAVGDEYSEQMRKVRELQFEFMRFRQIASYATQWVGTFLGKYLDEPIGKSQKTIREINDYLRDNVIPISERIANVLGSVTTKAVSMGMAIGRGAKSIYDFWGALSEGEKSGFKFVTMLTGFGLALARIVKHMPWIGKVGATLGKLFVAASPLGKVIAIIGALSLAFASIRSMTEGGDSPFDALFGDKMLSSAFYGTLRGVLDVFKQLYTIYVDLDDAFRSLTGMGIIEAGLTSIKNTLVVVLNFIEFITNAISFLLGVVDDLVNQFRWLIDNPFTQGIISFIKKLYGKEDEGDGRRFDPTGYNPGYPTYNAMQPSTVNTNTSNSSQVYNIDVNNTITGSNATAIGKEVTRYNDIIARAQLAGS